MAKSRFAHLFADEKPAPKPALRLAPQSAETAYDPHEYNRKAQVSSIKSARFYADMISDDKAHGQMLGHDRMLFEGLLLRYGKRWILAELARCLKNFPSYRKDD